MSEIENPYSTIPDKNITISEDAVNPQEQLPKVTKSLEGTNTRLMKQIFEILKNAKEAGGTFSKEAEVPEIEELMRYKPSSYDTHYPNNMVSTVVEQEPDGGTIIQGQLTPDQVQQLKEGKSIKEINPSIITTDKEITINDKAIDREREPVAA